MLTSLQPFDLDRATRLALRGAAISTGAIVGLVTLFLLLESLPALWSVGPLRFFTDERWLPARGVSGGFNLLPMLVGTSLLTLGALILAVPGGLVAALFCRFYAPAPVGRQMRRLIEILSGVPSVVYGLWGLVHLVPLINRWQPPGQSLLAGILVLALMILPTIALLSEAALKGVPRELWPEAPRWASTAGEWFVESRCRWRRRVLPRLWF